MREYTLDTFFSDILKLKLFILILDRNCKSRPENDLSKLSASVIINQNQLSNRFLVACHDLEVLSINGDWPSSLPLTMGVP